MKGLVPTSRLAWPAFVGSPADVSIDSELFAPAGFDLGAETPEEIALAIISEIQSVFTEASGESLRERRAPIHGWNLVRTPAPSQVEEWATLAP